MPDMKLVVPAVITVAVLMAIAGSLDWLIAHPPVLILIIVGIAGAIFLFVRRKRTRNRV